MRLYEVLPLCDSYFMATFFDVAVIQEFVIKSSIYDSYLLVQVNYCNYS